MKMNFIEDFLYQKNRVKLDKITGVFEKNIDKSEFYAIFPYHKR